MVKPVVGCILAGGLAFLFMGLQMGVFGPNRGHDEDEEGVEAVVESRPAKKDRDKKEPPPPAKFPDDLAPAARARPVEKAAAYTPGERPHKLVFLRPNGVLHPWHKTHEEYHDDWWTDHVEEAELVVVLGFPRKYFLDNTNFNRGPSVERFRWELEISVVEARTGRVRASRTFLNTPRPIRPVEDYGLTSIGQPVQYRTVFQWVSNHAKAGFPDPIGSGPIMITVGD